MIRNCWKTQGRRKFDSHQVKVKQLRSFGLIVGTIFALIGGWPLLFGGNSLRVWLLPFAGVLITQALILPNTLGPFHRVWHILGHAMGWLNTRILLSLAFYGIVAPMGLVLRALGKDPMHRKIDPHTSTYRIKRSPRPASHVQRQF
jgi:hypothetical protein